MIFKRQVTSSTFIYSTCLALVLVFFLGSCLTVKNYPPNKAFVFKSNIKIDSKQPINQKDELKEKLLIQLDDSIKNRIVTKMLIKKKLENPPAFDTSYAVRSTAFMKALLKSQGYISGSVRWDSTLVVKKKKKKQQLRVITTFTATPGPLTTIDSISYSFRDTTLQGLTLRSVRRSDLKKGDAFKKEAIAAELDRLIDVFKNNGYFKISREDVYAEVDTVEARLINPNIDIFERARLLNELEKQRDHPTVDIVFKQRAKEIPSHLRKFYIDKVSIYPDLSIREDSVETPYKKDTIRGITVFSRYNLFKPKFVVDNNYLKPGDQYSQRNYLRTINSYNQLGAWQQTAIDIFSNDSLGKLNMDVRLYPAVRRNLNIGLEASRNESDVVATNLFGLGVTFGVTDKNIAKQSVQSSLNTRFGVELGQNLLQTIQTSINYTLHFPKFILPFKDSSRIKGKISTEGTNLSINASNTLRKDFYTIQNANIAWSYDWTKGRDITRKNKIYLFNYSPINVEYQHVIPTDSLKGLITEAPNLYYTFQDGFIISQNFRFQVITTKGKHTTSVKTGIEESGGLLGLIKNLDVDAKLFRFVKTFIDYSHNITYKKTALAFHAYGGYGFSYGKTKDSLGNVINEQALPVTRGFTAGGPNSMRAWRARQLGPGSSRFYNNLSQDLDRFGDIQLEGNVEYRYNLFNIGSMKVKSALFADMGNIWLRNNQGQEGLNDGVFKLNRLYKDLAVGAGTSLRFDFDYFLIRLDWAYTFKNPYYSDTHNGWFQQIKFFDGQFQLGINYPF
jgi:hypothetical protein